MNARIDARWTEIDALFDALLDQPAASRERWLQAHCADEELRKLVASLLAADTAHAVGLEARAATAHARLSAQALPQVPGYRVIELLGEGGMASVFLAERALGKTVQRVALKRLRLNTYDRIERRRFEREHRVLARLEHPGIARLLDAGIAPDGVPWFAMELVDGQPLTAWCDARRLGTDARLALFVAICEAVQHAHRYLVVHCDLKPSNILVGQDGKPKLLDFGIARLLDPDGHEDPRTHTGLRRLTPGYAAPEQYRGHATTATDIYALGMVLIELLSGRRPVFGDNSAEDAGAASSFQPLRDLAIGSAEAGARSSSPRALQRAFAGDLGAIARKATRRDPALRYASAQALSEDVQAWREGRPVGARHGDWRYRVRCFAGRHKTAFAAGVLVAATLVATTAISLYQARQAREQAARAVAVQAFVEKMLSPLRTGVPAARMPKLDEVLALGVQELENRRGRDPAVYADLLAMFAGTYDRMGDVRTARTLADRAYAHNLAAFGRGDVRTIQALALRGRLRVAASDALVGRDDLEQALTQMRRARIRGVALANVQDEMAGLEMSLGRPANAEALYREANRQRLDELGPDHPDLAIGYANLALAEEQLGRMGDALALYEKAWRHASRHIGFDTRDATTYLYYVARTKGELGQWPQAERDFARTLAALDRVGPQDHAVRADVLFSRCFNATRLDDMAIAQAACDAAVAVAIRLWGEGSRMHQVARRFRLPMLAAQGRLREAHEESAQIRAALATAPGDLAPISRNLLDACFSDVQRIEGDYAGMRDSLLQVFRHGLHAGWRRLEAPLTARLALACAYAPDPDCAPGLAARADSQLAALPSHDPMRIEVQLPMARLALHRGNLTDADARLDDLAATAAQPQLRLPSTHRWLAEARMLRGDVLAAHGDRRGALAAWRAADAVFAARYAPGHPFRRELAARLGARALAR